MERGQDRLRRLCSRRRRSCLVGAIMKKSLVEEARLGVIVECLRIDAGTITNRETGVVAVNVD